MKEVEFQRTVNENPEEVEESSDKFSDVDEEELIMIADATSTENVTIVENTSKKKQPNVEVQDTQISTEETSDEEILRIADADDADINIIEITSVREQPKEAKKTTEMSPKEPSVEKHSDPVVVILESDMGNETSPTSSQLLSQASPESDRLVNAISRGVVFKYLIL